MKRIDLHIHTVSTPSDPPFEYDFDVLKQYVSECSLDMIAITNHNQFDRAQFEEITRKLSISVLPGIEIDIEDGHLLVITSESDIDDFEGKCKKIHTLIPNENISITETDFLSVFDNLEKYLIIPHYRKKPSLDLNRVPNISKYINTGETGSKKQFIVQKKDISDLVPVFFSDNRIRKGSIALSACYTLIDIDETNFSSLRLALMDRNKVSVDESDMNELINVPNTQYTISSGLTVVMGARSSGKSYVLNKIAENYEKPKYIEQFSLVSMSGEKEKERFEETIKRRSDSVSESFLKEFKDVIDDIQNVDAEKDENELDNFLEMVLKAGENAERNDVYSKTGLYSETPYEIKNFTSLSTLIESVDQLIENKEYKNDIEEIIPRESLLKLGIKLRRKYIESTKVSLRKKYINDIVSDIQNKLSLHTALPVIPQIDLYKYKMNQIKVEKFNLVANSIKTERVINHTNAHSFTIQAKARKFNGALEMRNFSRKRNTTFSDLMDLYQNNPYKFLLQLKGLNEIAQTELYKYFAFVEYKVFNKYGTEASGGERSEFNLLQELEDSNEYEILILDEPESSFDNIFLKNDIDLLLKEISTHIPVVISTHNNTLGASIHPDYVLYTKKDTADPINLKYQVFGGKPSSNELIDVDGNKVERKAVFLDCLEAGESAYLERRGTYEVS